MSAATNRAPNLSEIATEIAKANPDWNREAVYAQAYRQHTIAMRAFSSQVVDRVKNDPAVMNAIRLQRAKEEARRALPPEPDVSLLWARERARLMREGYTLEEAVQVALETAREASRLWHRAALQETSVILARDASKPIALAAPPAPTAVKAAPTVEHFIPIGMTRREAIDAAERGHLPTRAVRSPTADQHARLMGRVRELQATRVECKDYTAAYVAATREIAAEDERAEIAATMTAATGAK